MKKKKEKIHLSQNEGQRVLQIVSHKVGEFGKGINFHNREERSTWQKGLYRADTADPEKTAGWCKDIDSFEARMKRRSAPRKSSANNLGDFLKDAGQQVITGTPTMEALVMNDEHNVSPKQRPPSARNDKREYDAYMAAKTSCIHREWDEDREELEKNWMNLRNFPVVKAGDEKEEDGEGKKKKKPLTKEELQEKIKHFEEAVINARAIKDYARLGESQRFLEELQAQLVVVKQDIEIASKNKLHWALLRYGGMESEQINPSEWEAWENRKGKVKGELEAGADETIVEEEEGTAEAELTVAEKEGWMAKERRKRRDSHIFR
jgi:hypothetical protein